MATGSYQEEQAVLQSLEGRALDAEWEASQLRQSLPYEPTREEQAEYRQMLDWDDSREVDPDCNCHIASQDWDEMRTMRLDCPIHDKGRD